MFMMFHAPVGNRPWLVAIFAILLLIGGVFLILQG